MRRFSSLIIKKYFIFLFVVVSSCNSNSELNQALDLAGGNKQELEKVLNHYRQNSSDSLKYKATVFLIENMPYHVYYAPISYFDSAFDSIQNYPKSDIRRDVFENILDSVYEVSNSRKTELIFDIESLKSDFIINNIELAFKAWLKIPKDKRASFDEFCNYILPYRNSDEPIEENSREDLFNKYSWVHDYLNKGGNLRFVIDSITSEFNFINLSRIRNYYPSSLSISQMEKSRLGLCDDGVNYFVNVFRSLGIICAKDMVTHWGNHYTSGHSWIYSKYGEQEYSTNIQGNNDLKVKFKDESIPKIERVTYAYEKNLTFSPFSIDVTSDYVQTLNLDVKNILNIPISQPVLCVFDRNRQWVSVANGIFNDNKEVLYKNLGINVLYMAATKRENEITPINYPFYIDYNKKIHFFKPKENVQDSVILTRKYGLSSPRNRSKVNWLDSLNGGFFEGANDAKFKNSKTLYQISNLQSTQITKIELNIKEKFKYVRFNSNEQESFLAKLAFYDNRDKQLRGKVIKENNLTLIWENGAYDDDPLSLSGGKNFTLGLNFNEPKSIGFLEFQPRNDDNHINVGEDYELFYWDKYWKSLGEQKAKDTVLYYNVPENSLLWLKNLTKGKEEHVFIIDKNKKQKWLGFDNY